GKVVFEVPGVKGTFTGTLSEDGEKLEGKWKQGFVSPSLVLEKVDVAEADADAAGPNRPQTPLEPFPYNVSELTFYNEAAGIKLAATLTVPKQSSNPVPAVVMVSGSGPQDRDESLAGHKPFWVISDHFSRQGIAVLRFDDRGVGKSEGDYASATSADLASDAAAAVEFLRSRQEVDPKRIGICGHSEGGLIAPMVAAKDKDLAFVILMAGTGVNGEEILKSQSVLILKASGASERIIEQQSALQKALLKLALQNPALEAQAFVEKAEELVVELTDAKEGSAEANAAAKAAAAQLGGPWMRYFLQYEPTTNLEKLSCAVLAINGSKDLQVDPDLNLPVIEKALKKAPTENYKIVELDGLNHLFQHANTGSPSEYGDIEETFDPATLKLMSDWILGL
ncbi:MAG: alpha/beta fold hydrolase, partial [Planctomycetota bacterium]